MTTANHSPQPKTTFILVRHGETAWNAEERLQGQADPGLSDVGREQVAQIRHVVQRLNPSRIICSDLLRTRETAAILGYDTPVLDARLREADLGAWTGQYVADLIAQSSESYTAWRHGQFTPPGAESWPRMCQRVQSILESLSRCGEPILVVTHGGPIRAACAQFLGLEPQHVLPVRSASVTIIEFKEHARLGVYNLRPDDVEFKRTD
jgi:glucosyl-3-phosphoglycerate phosphatase